MDVKPCIAPFSPTVSFVRMLVQAALACISGATRLLPLILRRSRTSGAVVYGCGLIYFIWRALVCGKMLRTRA